MPKLDKRAVEGAQPKGRAYIIWDEDLPGFGLRVYASGRRTYLIQYKEDGRTRQFSMGSHEDMTPATARQKAKKLLADVATADTDTESAPTRHAKPAAQEKTAAEPPASVTLSRRPLARVSAANVGPAPSLKSPDTGLRAESDGLSEPPPPESGFRRIGAVLVLIGALVIGGLWYASETTELVRTATTTDEPVPPEGGNRQPQDAVADESTGEGQTQEQAPTAVAAASPSADDATATPDGQTGSGADSDPGNAAADGDDSAMESAKVAAQSDDPPAANEEPETVAGGTGDPAAKPAAVGNTQIAAAETNNGDRPRVITAAESAAALRPAAGATAKPPAPAEVAIARTEIDTSAQDADEMARLPRSESDDMIDQFNTEQELEEIRRRADRNPPPHECDRLAVDSTDPAKEVAGASGDSADPSAAVRACEDAVTTYPNAARFKAQYANAMKQAGNAEEAVKWHRRAANQGHSAAQFQLGQTFATGSGVSQDYAEAYFWYTLALRRGNVAAGRSRDTIEKELTRHQKESIGRRVRSWRPIP